MSRDGPRDAAQRRRRSRVRDVGTDPDPRFTFANERTFLAWNRTALALIAGGLAIAQLLEFDVEAARLIIALPLIALGAVVGLTSYQRWQASERAMRLQEPLPPAGMPRVLAAGVAVVSVAAASVAIIELIAG